MSGEAIWDVVLACEQALRGPLAAGQEKEGELATTSLNLNSTSNSLVAPSRLSCQNSANQREAETSTNVLFYRRREEASENKYIYYCVTENTASVLSQQY